MRSKARKFVADSDEDDADDADLAMDTSEESIVLEQLTGERRDPCQDAFLNCTKMDSPVL